MIWAALLVAVKMKTDFGRKSRRGYRCRRPKLETLNAGCNLAIVARSQPGGLQEGLKSEY